MQCLSLCRMPVRGDWCHKRLASWIGGVYWITAVGIQGCFLQRSKKIVSKNLPWKVPILGKYSQAQTAEILLGQSGCCSSQIKSLYFTAPKLTRSPCSHGENIAGKFWVFSPCTSSHAISIVQQPTIWKPVNYNEVGHTGTCTGEFRWTCVKGSIFSTISAIFTTHAQLLPSDSANTYEQHCRRGP